MKKYLRIIIFTILTMVLFVISFVYAKALTDQELESFVTRDEFVIFTDEIYKEIDDINFAINKQIFNDLDFYDMQYKFTQKYTASNNYGGYGSQEALDIAIENKKAERGSN